MTIAPTMGDVSPGLLKVIERAKRDPEVCFTSLSHLLDEQALRRAYDRLRKEASVGVDGITKEQYGLDLEHNLRDLHGQMREMRYRHQPIRRVHIPKDKGKTRPIGISCLVDKVVQGALCEVLEAIYEPVFFDGSYGFRRGRSAHDALRALNQVLHAGKVTWILEADITSFFDSIDRKMLVELLRERVIDGPFLRLVGKCLHVGILDGAEHSEPDAGTVQGSSLSPMLGNIYLHHVLDLWFERDVQPRLRGHAQLIRYADDFVITFEDEGRRAAGGGGALPAFRAIRSDAASGQDPPFSLWSPAERPDKWKGPGDLRFPRIHALLVPDPRGAMGAGCQDAHGAAPTGHCVRRRLLPTPSA